MKEVIILIEKINNEYKGQLFINGMRELVTVDKDKSLLYDSLIYTIENIFNVRKYTLKELKIPNKTKAKIKESI